MSSDQSTDRRVHATAGDLELVRYERAGKWYIEHEEGRVPREQVSLIEATITARGWVLDMGGEVRLGVPGETAFDRKLKDLVMEA